ncbi:MAG: sigma-70 family RNA polymerase sigma factor [Fimbriimonadales bacterium]|nr:sigma-70 family RNA polymerase sigma factor [Fimbriimonadales bacterium]
MLKRDTEELVLEYCQTRDLELRDAITIQLSGLVESIARKFLGSGEPIEDLIQEGYLGLLNALDLFKPDKGVKFTTYATHLIIGQIKHYLRDKGKIIKEPAWLQELNSKINRVINELSARYGRPPTTQEIAEFLGMTTKAVEDVLMTREVFKVSSLDAIYEDDEEEWNGYDLEKLNCEPCQTFNLPIEERVVVETAMQQLKQIEQQVLHLFFNEGYNQTEIAHRLKISCNYVSHILRNATQKLRRIISEAEWLDEQRFRARALERGDFEARILDPQTGLFSADYLSVRLREEVQRAARYDQSVGFAIFEFVADRGTLTSLGEFALGELLLQAAAVVRETVRKADIVGRYGHATLGLLMPYAGEHAPRIAQRVAQSLQEWLQTTFSPNMHQRFEVFFGWAFYPHDCADHEQLLRQSEQRLREQRAQQRLQNEAA